MLILEFFFLNFYLFMIVTEREREREAETQAEGEAGSMQGARRGTRSQDPGVTPWTKGGAKPLSHPGAPVLPFFFFFKRIDLFVYSRDTHRGRDTGRGRSRHHAGSLTWNSILGPQDRALGQMQALNR